MYNGVAPNPIEIFRAQFKHNLYAEAERQYPRRSKDEARLILSARRGFDMGPKQIAKPLTSYRWALSSFALTALSVTATFKFFYWAK